MITNYLFVALLTAMWLAAFVYPFKRKPRRNVLRLLTFLRYASLWWVLGMSYRFLGFLVPDFILPNTVDWLLSYTIALPSRLGEGVEHVRTSALGTQFDLALAMIFALGWSFLGSSLILALKGSLKKRLTRQRTRQTAMESGNNVG
ncbi:MAG: hypothetical protein DDT37_01403 [Firmicutes bacterium]|nr:hypothetical protein [candidate division NPL-UPA2 bacterium]